MEEIFFPVTSPMLVGDRPCIDGLMLRPPVAQPGWGFAEARPPSALWGHTATQVGPTGCRRLQRVLRCFGVFLEQTYLCRWRLEGSLRQPWARLRAPSAP